MIRVFIVDDSAVVRQTLTEILSGVADIEVVGTASDPIFARTKLESGWPDVIILDIEMPRMDGLTFLGHIMQEHPTPVIICSSLTTEGAKWTLNALAAGAVEVIAKPEHGLKNFLEEYRENLVRAIRSAAASGKTIHRITRLSTPESTRLISNVQESEVYPGIKAPTSAADKTFRRAAERIVVLGASAGGANAIEVILTRLTADCPGIAIVQHMPEKFTDAFARRLDSLCAINVREARDGDLLTGGVALIAPGNLHMVLEQKGPHYGVRVKDGPRINHHRPSVDVLFRSVAGCGGGANILGVILTGMGNDGARGMLEMRERGVRTIAQDKESCVVYGMPREAVERGGVEMVLTLQDIPAAIMQHAQRDGIHVD